MNDNIIKLNNYFKEKFRIDFLDTHSELKSEHLFSRRIGIEPINLLFIYAFIENELNTNVNEEFIMNEKFTSFDNICTLFNK